MDVLISIVAFVVAVGVLVAIHEFGHFWVARRLGVKVIRYSVGFGPAIWSHQKSADSTEYRIAAVPLGGYVKMLNSQEGEVEESERHLAFDHQSPSRRIAIVAAGPIANFIFAIMAYAIMFMIGINGTKPIVGDVTPGTLAAEQGLRSGDEVLKVGDHDINTWDAVRVRLLDAMLDGKSVSVVVRRPDGSEHTAQLPLEKALEQAPPDDLLQGIGMRHWEPPLPALLGEVIEGGAAATAGLQRDDLIVSVNGEQVADWVQWVRVVRISPNKRLNVVVERNGQPVELTVVPIATESGAETIGRINAAVQITDSTRELWKQMTVEVRYGPLEAVGKALGRTWEMSALTLRMLWKMVTLEVSWRNVSGPINIAQYAGYSAQIGVSAFLSFLAIVSVSLGVLNLLPIPVLDGGHLAYYLVEMIKRKPMSEEAQALGRYVGLVMLLMLMSIAFYNDVVRLMG